MYRPRPYCPQSPHAYIGHPPTNMNFPNRYKVNISNNIFIFNFNVSSTFPFNDIFRNTHVQFTNEYNDSCPIPKFNGKVT